MEPLDLTHYRPRSVRVAVDGIVYLARAIDKVRAQLPGGDLGPYLVLSDEITTISAMFYRRLGIDHGEFAAAVRDAQSEADVAAWVRARATDENVAKWNERITTLAIGTIPEPLRTRVRATHAQAGAAPDDMLLVDLIDADDHASFATG